MIQVSGGWNQVFQNYIWKNAVFRSLGKRGRGQAVGKEWFQDLEYEGCMGPPRARILARVHLKSGQSLHVQFQN